MNTNHRNRVQTLIVRFFNWAIYLFFSIGGLVVTIWGSVSEIADVKINFYEASIMGMFSCYLVQCLMKNGSNK